MSDIRASKATIIDSHCHVVKEYFGDEQEDVIARAFDQGVVQLVNPCVSMDDTSELIALADRFERLYIGLGVHPHESKFWHDESAQRLISQSSHAKVVAIGECGLDYFYKNSEPVTQRRVF